MVLSENVGRNTGPDVKRFVDGLGGSLLSEISDILGMKKHDVGAIRDVFLMTTKNLSTNDITETVVLNVGSESEAFIIIKDGDGETKTFLGEGVEISNSSGWRRRRSMDAQFGLILEEGDSWTQGKDKIKLKGRKILDDNLPFDYFTYRTVLNGNIEVDLVRFTGLELSDRAKTRGYGAVSTGISNKINEINRYVGGVYNFVPDDLFFKQFHRALQIVRSLPINWVS